VLFVYSIHAATNAAATTATKTASTPVVTEVAESKLLLADEPSPVGGSDGAMDGAQLG